jgi:predicted DNA-binding ribbon-helix-helix protein
MITKRSVVIAGHPTSVTVETAFWEELKAIAEARGVSLNHLIAEIDQARTGNLSSAIRLFVLADLKRHTSDCTPGTNLKA